MLGFEKPFLRSGIGSRKKGESLGWFLEPSLWALKRWKTEGRELALVLLSDPERYWKRLLGCLWAVLWGGLMSTLLGLWKSRVRTHRTERSLPAGLTSELQSQQCGSAYHPWVPISLHRFENGKDVYPLRRSRPSISASADRMATLSNCARSVDPQLESEKTAVTKDRCFSWILSIWRWKSYVLFVYERYVLIHIDGSVKNEYVFSSGSLRTISVADKPNGLGWWRKRTDTVSYLHL